MVKCNKKKRKSERNKAKKKKVNFLKETKREHKVSDKENQYQEIRKDLRGGKHENMKK